MLANNACLHLKNIKGSQIEPQEIPELVLARYGRDRKLHLLGCVLMESTVLI